MRSPLVLFALVLLALPGCFYAAEPPDLSLQAGDVTGLLNARLSDGLEPALGASVKIVGSSVGTVSKSGGRYTLRNLPEGTRTIAASLDSNADGEPDFLARMPVTIRIPPGKTERTWVNLGSVELLGVGTLRGTVAVGAEPPALLQDAWVSVDGRIAAVDAATGAFVVRGLPQGELQVTAGSASCLSPTTPVRLTQGDVALDAPLVLTCSATTGSVSGNVRTMPGDEGRLTGVRVGWMQLGSHGTRSPVDVMGAAFGPLELPQGLHIVRVAALPSDAFQALDVVGVVVRAGENTKLGELLLGTVGACQDRDGDGVCAMPPDSTGACVEQCLSQGNLDAPCTLEGGKLDCDDDGDLQPDPEEWACSCSDTPGVPGPRGCQDDPFRSDKDKDGVCDLYDRCTRADGCPSHVDGGFSDAATADAARVDSGTMDGAAGDGPMDGDGGVPILDAGQDGAVDGDGGVPTMDAGTDGGVPPMDAGTDGGGPPEVVTVSTGPRTRKATLTTQVPGGGSILVFHHSGTVSFGTGSACAPLQTPHPDADLLTVVRMDAGGRCVWRTAVAGPNSATDTSFQVRALIYAAGRVFLAFQGTTALVGNTSVLAGFSPQFALLAFSDDPMTPGALVGTPRVLTTNRAGVPLAGLLFDSTTQRLAVTYMDDPMVHLPMVPAGTEAAAVVDILDPSLTQLTARTVVYTSDAADSAQALELFGLSHGSVVLQGAFTGQLTMLGGMAPISAPRGLFNLTIPFTSAGGGMDAELALAPFTLNPSTPGALGGDFMQRGYKDAAGGRVDMVSYPGTASLTVGNTTLAGFGARATVLLGHTAAPSPTLDWYTEVSEDPLCGERNLPVFAPVAPGRTWVAQSACRTQRVRNVDVPAGSDGVWFSSSGGQGWYDAAPVHAVLFNERGRPMGGFLINPSSHYNHPAIQDIWPDADGTTHALVRVQGPTQTAELDCSGKVVSASYKPLAAPPGGGGAYAFHVVTLPTFPDACMLQPLTDEVGDQPDLTGLGTDSPMAVDSSVTLSIGAKRDEDCVYLPGPRLPLDVSIRAEVDPQCDGERVLSLYVRSNTSGWQNFANQVGGCLSQQFAARDGSQYALCGRGYAGQLVGNSTLSLNTVGPRAEENCRDANRLETPGNAGLGNDTIFSTNRLMAPSCGPAQGPVLFQSMVVPAFSAGTFSVQPYGQVDVSVREVVSCGGLQCSQVENSGGVGERENITVDNPTATERIALLAVGGNGMEETTDFQMDGFFVPSADDDTHCGMGPPVTLGVRRTGSLPAMGDSLANTCVPEATNPVSYHSILVPPGAVDVKLGSYNSVDVMARVLDGCGASACLSTWNARSDVWEFVRLRNPTGTPVQRILAVSTVNGEVASYDLVARIPEENSNARCTGAAELTYGEDYPSTRGSVNPVQGTGCTAQGAALYYNVAVPAGTQRTVRAVSRDSALDPVLMRLSGTCGQLTCEETVDAEGAGGAESLVLRNDGADMMWVRIAVAGRGPDELGDVTLSSSTVSNQDTSVCSAAPLLAPGTRTAGSTASGVDDLSGSCVPNGTGGAAYYRVVLPPRSSFNASVYPTNAPDLVLRDLDACGGSCVTSSNNNGQWSQESMRLVNASTAPMEHVLAVGTTSGVSSYVLETVETVPPRQAVCATAPLVSSPSNNNHYLDSTLDTLADASCGGPLGPVYFLRFLVDAGARVTVTAQGYLQDVVLSRVDDCASLHCSEMVNAVAAGQAEKLVLENTTAATVAYLVAVGGASLADRGAVQVSSAVEPSPNVRSAVCAAAAPLPPRVNQFWNTAESGDDLSVACLPTSTAPVSWHAVEVPPFSTGAVYVAPLTSWDVTMRALDSCSPGMCASSVNGAGPGSTESLALSNATGTPITQLVAVGHVGPDGGGYRIGTLFNASSTNACNTGSWHPLPFADPVVVDLLAGGVPLPEASCGGAQGDVGFVRYELPPRSSAVLSATNTTGQTLMLRALSNCATSLCDQVVTASSAAAPATMTVTNPSLDPVAIAVAVGAQGTGNRVSATVTAALSPLDSGETCEAAPLATRNQNTVGATRVTGSNTATCLPSITSAEDFHVVRVPPRAQVLVRVRPEGNWDPVIRVREACDSASCIGRNAKGDAGEEELRLDNPSMAIKSFVVSVASADARTGTYVLQAQDTQYNGGYACESSGPLITPPSVSFDITTHDVPGTLLECGMEGAVRWFPVDVPAMSSGLVVVSTAFQDVDIMLAEQASCLSTGCFGAINVGGPGQTESMTLTNASSTVQTHLIAVGTKDAGVTGTLHVGLEFTPLASGATCATAASLTRDQRTTGSTLDGTASLAACAPGTDGSMAFHTFTLPAHFDAVITATPYSNWDVVLAESDDCSGTTCGQLVNNNGDGTAEVMRVTNSGNTPVTRTLVVAAATGAGGTYDLVFSPIPYETLPFSAACQPLVDSEEIIQNGQDGTATDAILLPFPFTYFGDQVVAFRAASDGWLQLGATTSINGDIPFNNLQLPTPGLPGGIVAPFWDDLDTQSGTVQLATSGDAALGTGTLTVEWRAVGFWGNAGTPALTFRVTLEQATGAVVIHYCQMTSDDQNRAEGNDATVGLGSLDGKRGLTTVYNNGGVTLSGTGFRYVPR